MLAIEFILAKAPQLEPGVVVAGKDAAAFAVEFHGPTSPGRVGVQEAQHAVLVADHAGAALVFIGLRQLRVVHVSLHPPGGRPHEQGKEAQHMAIDVRQRQRALADY